MSSFELSSWPSNGRGAWKSLYISVDRVPKTEDKDWAI